MADINPDTLDRADMKKLVGGEDAALDRLMERHATGIFHFLYRMLGQAEDANDLAQETFARVYLARNSYRSNKRFNTWLYTIAGNLARNQMRWRTRHPTISLDAKAEMGDTSFGEQLASPTVSPHKAADVNERAQAVFTAVQSLPGNLREAIVLCEWEDLSMADAALVLNTTPKAVESRLYRARQLLREQLKAWL